MRGASRGSDAAERGRAAADWNAWEAAHVSFDGSVAPGRRDGDEGAAAVFATLVTRYWANDGFLPGDRAILSRMDRIAGIPAVLIHGRRDVSGPAVTPWRLHRSWPASRLTLVEGAGHGGPEMLALVREACDGFAA